MNNINNIYTTVSGSRTYIAADKKYLGNVNSYNNFLTRFVANLFSRSIRVDFDGKKRSVNKESYVKLLKRLGADDADIKNIERQSLFKGFAEEATLPDDKKLMKDAIKKKDSAKHFRKLASAIHNGKEERALKLIGKGAELDTVYFERAGRSPSFDTYTDNLDSESAYKFDVLEGSPILVAAYKGNTAVVNRLKEYGAKTDGTLEKYTFKRVITGVKTDYNWVYDYQGNWHEVAYTRVNTEDTQKKHTFYQLDSSLTLVPKAGKSE